MSIGYSFQEESKIHIHFRHLRCGEHGAFLTDINIPDIAAAAFAHSAFHAVFECRPNILCREAQISQDGQSELDHYGRATNHCNGLLELKVFFPELIFDHSVIEGPS